MNHGRSLPGILSICVVAAVRFLGLKTALDQMVHMLPDAQNPIGIDLIRKWFHGMRMALAFQQTHVQSSVQLRNKIVEADGSSTMTCRASSKAWHLKRRKRKLSQAQRTALEVRKNKLKAGGFAARVANKAMARGTRKKVVHHGRMLWVAGRFSRKCVALPVKPTATLQGAPSPGEDLKSVRRGLQK